MANSQKRKRVKEEPKSKSKSRKTSLLSVVKTIPTNITENLDLKTSLLEVSTSNLQQRYNIPAPTQSDSKDVQLKRFESHQLLAQQSRKYVGAHVSIGGGLSCAIDRSVELGGTALACFLTNQKRWENPPLKLKDAEQFQARCKDFGFSPSEHILPHGSYLVNLGNPDPHKRQRSFQSFKEELKRCEMLGILRFNFHPGSSVGQCERSESISHIATCINDAHAATKTVVCVLENMAGGKNVVGTRFEDLKHILELVHDKKRVGVCLDTCHLFASGYDISTFSSFDAVLKSFDSIVGLHYLMGIHLNDSKNELGSGLDRHEHLGHGKIGMKCFEFIMTDPRFSNIPMVLETPGVVNDNGLCWSKEIHMLYSFVNRLKC